MRRKDSCSSGKDASLVLRELFSSRFPDFSHFLCFDLCYSMVLKFINWICLDETVLDCASEVHGMLFANGLAVTGTSLELKV